MKKPLLEVKNLSVKIDRKNILHHINLKIYESEIYILIGPNGSGKSTLANAIMGLTHVKITAGSIIFKNKNINTLPPEKRFLSGISLVFQNPPPIKGVTLNTISSYFRNKFKKGRVNSSFVFPKELTNLLDRDINDGFSGGEKKISELFQISLNKNNRLIIFDEIDSGLDLDKLKLVTEFIKQKSKKDKIAFLIITHREELLKLINPTHVAVILGGKILCCSNDWHYVFRIIKRYGYEHCKKCEKLSNINNDGTSK